MPDDPHAVSACLPLWEHNIGYEEGRPEVLQQLQAAYPRFCFHPLVSQLCDQRLNSQERRGLPFVSAAAARRAIEYVTHAGVVSAEQILLEDYQACGVTVANADFSTLKQYWQHAGENVSSRVAEQIIAGQASSITETLPRQTVRSRVAAIHGTSPTDVYLFASGMAAIAATWRSVKFFRGSRSCQFGFPYVDTLKIQQRFPNAVHEFYPVGSAADLQLLRQQCQIQPPDVIYCEVPTNPLLVMPDLSQLRQIADQFNIVLIVDDTLAACGNLITLKYADAVVTSLTKYFSGYGNVLAGALVLNSAGPNYAALHSAVDNDFQETLSDVDTAVLCENSTDLTSRITTINANAQHLAEFLNKHPEVAAVYYPTAADANYETAKSQAGGYGGLLSIVLKDAPQMTSPAFDALDVCKGPNLGTYFTLCCPYTILAHYTELPFAEQCGVSQWLLRISVGVEPAEELTQRFAAALASARRAVSSAG